MSVEVMRASSYLARGLLRFAAVPRFGFLVNPSLPRRRPGHEGFAAHKKYLAAPPESFAAPGSSVPAYRLSQTRVAARKVALICFQQRRNQSPPAPHTDKEASMKLYYMLESCALAPQIVANEAGIPVQPVRVDFKTKTTAAGGDYFAINAKGYVPALELDDGEVLTENAAIVQYLADLKPQVRLAPANGTLARVRLQEALNYI